MTTNRRILYIAVLVIFAISNNLPAQSKTGIPFYFAAGTSFDPQIASVAVALPDSAPAIASADKKYVTLDLHSAMNGLKGLSNFTFERPGLGFVGSPAAVAGITKGAGGSSSAPGSGKDPAPAQSPNIRNGSQVGKPADAALGTTTSGTTAYAHSPGAPVSPSTALLASPGMTLIAPLH